MSVRGLEARDIHLRRGGRQVLSGISASFARGEWTAIVGPNGAGKSTFLSALAGLLRPASGSVILDQQAIGSWPVRERARRIAWLSQDANLVGDMAGRDMVRLGRMPDFGYLGSPGPADEVAVDAALADMDAEDFAARRVNELSGGERQRILLARIFASSAHWLLLDEPTVHLDAPHQRRLVEAIRRKTRAGLTVVSVLHDLTLALAADRLLVLCDGRLEGAGAPADPQLRASLIGVFGDAIAIEPLGPDGRWAAIPLV